MCLLSKKNDQDIGYETSLRRDTSMQMTKCQALALHQLQINAHCKLLNKTLGDRIGHASLMLSAPISLRHSSIASNMAFALATSKPRARRKRNNEWSSSRLRNSPCSVRTSRRLFRASCWDCVRSPGRLLIMSSSLVDEVPGDWLWEEVQWHRSWSMAQWQSSHVTTRKRCAASTDASFRILLLLQSILQILNPSKNILGCIMLKEDLLSDAFWRNRSTPVYREKTHTHTPQTLLLQKNVPRKNSWNPFSSLHNPVSSR